MVRYKEPLGVNSVLKYQQYCSPIIRNTSNQETRYNAHFCIVPRKGIEVIQTDTNQCSNG